MIQQLKKQKQKIEQIKHFQLNFLKYIIEVNEKKSNMVKKYFLR